MELGPTISGSQDCHHLVLLVQCIPGTRTSNTPCAWIKNVRTFAILGESVCVYTGALRTDYFRQSHAVVAFAVSLIGVGYWYVWCVWLPRKKGYRLERTWVLQEDGVSRCVFRQTPL